MQAVTNLPLDVAAENVIPYLGKDKKVELALRAPLYFDYAAEAGIINVQELVPELIRAGDIRTLEKHNVTFGRWHLFIAIRTEDAGIINLVLDNMVVSLKPGEQERALQEAVETGNVDVVDNIQEYVNEVGEINVIENEAVEYAAEVGNVWVFRQLGGDADIITLNTATRFGNVEVVDYILGRLEEDPRRLVRSESCPGRRGPILAAIEQGHLNVLKSLVGYVRSHGVDPKTLELSAETPAEHGDVNMVRYLIEELQAPVPALDAGISGGLKMVRLLYQHGAESIDYAFKVAVDNDNYSIAELDRKSVV